MSHDLTTALTGPAPAAPTKLEVEAAFQRLLAPPPVSTRAAESRAERYAKEQA